jgi:CHASE1-domain containing sensor protein
MLAFLVFLVAFLWAFSAANVKRVWLVLAGGGLSMTAAASLVQRALL